MSITPPPPPAPTVAPALRPRPLAGLLGGIFVAVAAAFAAIWMFISWHKMAAWTVVPMLHSTRPWVLVAGIGCAVVAVLAVASLTQLAAVRIISAVCGIGIAAALAVGALDLVQVHRQDASWFESGFQVRALFTLTGPFQNGSNAQMYDRALPYAIIFGAAAVLALLGAVLQLTGSRKAGRAG